jgi:hypothetical protein
VAFHVKEEWVTLLGYKQWLVWILAVVLLASGAVNFYEGFHLGLKKLNTNDLSGRSREYAEFVQGIYPNRHLKREDRTLYPAHTVYPPYAIPMFALVFGNWSLPTASMLMLLYSFLGLFAMMLLGWLSLREHGIAAAVLGAAIPWGFSGILLAVAMRQFSIICVGLVALQILLSARNQQVASGICWTLAMVKPQIALPFAILFMATRQWRALLVGTLTLAALWIMALWWTGTGFTEYLKYAVFEQRLNFVDQSKHSIGFVIDTLGISPGTASILALLGLFFLGAIAWHFGKHVNMPPLMVAAAASVFGHTFFYHRRTDNMMLLPLALVLASLFFKGGYKLKEYFVYGAFYFSVFSMFNIFYTNPLIKTMMPAMAMALVPLTVWGLRRKNSPCQ